MLTDDEETVRNEINKQIARAREMLKMPVRENVPTLPGMDPSSQFSAELIDTLEASRGRWYRYVGDMLGRFFTDDSQARDFSASITGLPHPTQRGTLDQQVVTIHRHLESGIELLESLDERLHFYVREDKETAPSDASEESSTNTDLCAFTAARRRLLRWMVEAHRRAESSGVEWPFRGAFYLRPVAQPGPRPLWHRGVPDPIMTYETDLNALGERGLLTWESALKDDRAYDLTPDGIAAYETLQKERSEPVERIEAEIFGYIDAGALRTRYPLAYERWKAAEELLWGPQAKMHLTDIGHRCRETLIEFAKVLVARHKPNPVDLDVTHARARISQTTSSYLAL